MNTKKWLVKCELTFLSQPGMEILASYHWALMTVSMLSAMRSLDWRLNDMPLVPMEMPSLTPIVLNRNGTKPAWRTPSFTASESSRRCMLHVLPSYQTEEIPTWGFVRSSSERPTPRSIAWEPPWDLGSVTRELYLFSFISCFVVVVGVVIVVVGDVEMEARMVRRLLRWWWWGIRRVARGDGVKSVACIVDAWSEESDELLGGREVLGRGV